MKKSFVKRYLLVLVATTLLLSTAQPLLVRFEPTPDAVKERAPRRVRRVSKPSFMPFAQDAHFTLVVEKEDIRDKALPVKEPAPRPTPRTYKPVRKLTPKNQGQLHALLSAPILSQIREQGKRALTLGGRAVTAAKAATNPVKAIHDAYRTVVNKYFYAAINKKMDETFTKAIKESGLEKTPMGKKALAMKREHMPSIERFIKTFADKKFQDALERMSSRIVLPLIARSYDIPLTELTFHEYNNRQNQVNSVKVAKLVAKDPKILSKFQHAYESVLEMLGLDKEKVTAQQFDTILLPAFDKLLLQTNKEAQATINDLKKKKLPLTKEGSKFTLSGLRDGIYAARSHLLAQVSPDTHFQPTIPGLMQLYRDSLPTDLSKEERTRRIENHEKELTKTITQIYASALGHLGIDKKSRKEMKPEHLEMILAFFSLLEREGHDDKDVLAAAQKLVQAELPWSSNEKYKVKAHEKIVTAKGLKNVLPQLTWAHRRMLDEFSSEIKSWYDKKFGSGSYKSAAPLTYSTYLRQRLLPKMVAKHLGGKKIPFTDVVVAKDGSNIDEAMDKLEVMHGKVKTGVERVEKVYKAAKKAYDIYTITLDVVDALGLSLELAHNRNVPRYYSKLFKTFDVYAKSLDKLLGVLEIQERDLGLQRKFIESEVFGILPSFLQAEIDDIDIEKEKKLRKELDKLSSTKKALGTLRFLAHKYHAFHERFGRHFISGVDETGENIFQLKPEHVIKIGKAVLAPTALAAFKRMLKHVLTQATGSSTIATSLVSMLDERVIAQLKESLAEVNKGMKEKSQESLEREVAKGF